MEQVVADHASPADRLKYLSNRKIVVVDDAFDPPTLEDLYSDDIREFLEKLAENSGANQALTQMAGAEVKGAADLTGQVIQLLWAGRFSGTDLTAIACTTIFALAIDELANVTPFCDHLRELGFTIVEIGQSGDIPPQDVGLVLVDYVLGHEGTSTDLAELTSRKTEAIKASEAVTRRFYRQFTSDVEKPFVVLMSSRTAAEVLIKEFRENSNLLGGLFDFISKKDLCDRSTLEFKLRTWNYSLPSRHVIQHFVDALKDAIDDIAQSFRQALQTLSFEDYAYIQGLTLQEDGHPLGDYMLWLYSSLLGDLLQRHHSVVKQRVKLDSMEFDRFVPTQQPPSVGLSELYQSAVSLKVSEGLHGHPRELQPAAEAVPSPLSSTVSVGVSGMPYLSLGDVFVKDQASDVRMVLNAACDLAFAPNAQRACDPDQSVMFMLGQLVPLYSAPGDMSFPRTELFQVNGALFRVIWRPDRVFSLKHREVVEKMASDGYELKSRLRLPYALLVQQGFASKLTRIGLPVAPPICVAVDVDIYCADDNGNARKLCPTVVGGAFVIHRKRKNDFIQEFVLTGTCVQKLLERLDEVAEQQKRLPVRQASAQDADEPRRKADAEKRADRVEKRAKEVQAYKTRHDFWFSLVADPKEIPRNGKIVIDDSFLHLYCRGQFDGPWDRKPCVALNIQYGPEPSKVSLQPESKEASQ